VALKKSICQPLDVSVFSSVKKHWRNILTNWKNDKGYRYPTIPKMFFPRLLSDVMEAAKHTLQQNIISGFKKCGIIPFNPIDRFHCDDNAPSSRDAVSNVILQKLETIHQSLQVSCIKKKTKRLNVAPGKSVSYENILISNSRPGENDSSSSASQHASLMVAAQKDSSTERNAAVLPGILSPKPLRERIADRQGIRDADASTSRKRKHSMKSSQQMEKVQRVQSTTKKNARCCVCGILWSQVKEEWLRCTNCQQWACETCFLTNTCANCDD
jgi:hypothetical protein